MCLSCDCYCRWKSWHIYIWASLSARLIILMFLLGCPIRWSLVWSHLILSNQIPSTFSSPSPHTTPLPPPVTTCIFGSCLGREFLERCTFVHLYVHVHIYTHHLVSSPAILMRGWEYVFNLLLTLPNPSLIHPSYLNHYLTVLFIIIKRKDQNGKKESGLYFIAAII
uniref:Uncharacterized protein n=1 Tax=Austropuccinia psidii TaxID=181123 RepID=A0A513X022_9BASI|nr:hypothetical protein [Austropuccinia psidii]QDH07281.1 hypothetical protein [Austropuccinia psidii]